MDKTIQINFLNELLIHCQANQNYQFKCIGVGDLYFVFESENEKYKEKVLKVSKEQLYRILHNEQDTERICIEEDRINEMKEEIIVLKKYLDKGIVLDVNIEYIDCEIDLSILNQLFESKKKSIEKKVFKKIVCVIQKQISDLNDSNKYFSLDTNLVTYDNYLACNSQNEKERLIDSIIESHVKSVYFNMIKLPGFKEYLKHILVEINNYYSNTGKQLDIMGRNNIVLFKENNKWNSYFIDVISLKNQHSMQDNHRTTYTFNKTLQLLLNIVS